MNAPDISTDQTKAIEAQIETAEAALDALEQTVTQREWLLVCRKLDVNRSSIAQDGSLRLLALGWVKGKRDHGGADWDKLLDLTDEGLLALHGFPTEDAPVAEALPEPLVSVVEPVVPFGGIDAAYDSPVEVAPSPGGVTD